MMLEIILLWAVFIGLIGIAIITLFGIGFAIYEIIQIFRRNK